MDISIQEFAKRLNDRAFGKDSFLLLDVRNPNEQDICVIPNTDLLIPVKELEKKVADLNEYKSKEIIVYCRSGIRSQTACQILLNHGFSKVWNLTGGILLYIDEIDPELPKY